MTQLDLVALPPPWTETMFPDAGPEPVEAEQCDDPPVPADGSTRTLSYLMDLACIVAVAGPLWRLLYSPASTGIATAELVAVLILLRARTGHTPDALLSGMVIVVDGSDHAPDLRRQLVRTTLMIPLYVTVVDPLIISFFSRDSGGLASRVVGAAALDLWSEKSHPGSGDGDEGTGEPLLRGQENSNFLVPGAPVLPSSPAPAASPLTPRRAVSREPAPAAPPGNTQTDPLTSRRVASPLSTSPEPSSAPVTGSTGLSGTVRAWLVVGSSQREEMGPVLVAGRKPTGTNGERRLVISGPTNLTSRTHLRLDPTSGGVWVEDTTFTNGTAVRSATGAITHLVRDRRILLPPGTTIITGERTMMIMSGSLR